MEQYLNTLLLIIIFAPFAGSLLAGLLGKYLRVAGTNWITISLMAVSLALSIVSNIQCEFLSICCCR
jgi:hypothetical protein